MGNLLFTAVKLDAGGQTEERLKALQGFWYSKHLARKT